VRGLVFARRPRPGAVVGGVVLGACLGLAGCGALQEQVTKQGAELTELRVTVDGLRGDFQALRRQIDALQAALESADRRATAEREAGEARGRDTQDVLVQRLATVERRVDELGDGVTGLEVGTAALAEQFARLEAGTAAAVSPPRARPGPRQPGPPISAEELFDRAMES
jgi:outer membrane murein-binding lipoprotein Lpp